MKILITGHKGFIGSYLFPLLAKKHKVIGYDLVDGDDIRDRLKLDKLFEAENFDMVIHLAAMTGVRRGELYPDEYVSTNINGTHNIVRMCDKHDVKKLIFFSSSSVLGGCRKEMTPKEEANKLAKLESTYSPYLPLKEGDNCMPQSLYAITKLTGEMLVRNFRYGYLIIRPFTVYGENGRPDMVIYKWINQIKAGKRITVYGDGTTTRGYTYVKDLVRAVSQLVEGMEIKDKGLIHLGGSEIIELSHLFDIVYYHCKKKKIKFAVNKLPLFDADVHSSFADCKVAEQLLGFKPKPQFSQIVERILKKEL